LDSLTPPRGLLLVPLGFGLLTGPPLSRTLSILTVNLEEECPQGAWSQVYLGVSRSNPSLKGPKDSPQWCVEGRYGSKHSPQPRPSLLHCSVEIATGFLESHQTVALSQENVADPPPVATSEECLAFGILSPLNWLGESEAHVCSLLSDFVLRGCPLFQSRFLPNGSRWQQESGPLITGLTPRGTGKSPEDPDRIQGGPYPFCSKVALDTNGVGDFGPKTPSDHPGNFPIGPDIDWALDAWWSPEPGERLPPKDSIHPLDFGSEPPRVAPLELVFARQGSDPAKDAVDWWSVSAAGKISDTLGECGSGSPTGDTSCTRHLAPKSQESVT